MSSNTEVRLNAGGNFTNGVLSETGAVVATQPLDTIKTWILAGRGIPPRGALFNGTLANCSGAVVQGGLPFLVNGVLLEQVARGGEVSEQQRVAVAISTGVATSTLIAPLERVAKIHQLFGGTAIDAFWSSIKRGSGGVFKAIGPVAIRDAIVSGAFFGGRSVVETQLEGIIEDKKGREGIASVSVGVIAGALSTPADRLNVLMSGDVSNAYPSTLKTAKMVLQREGIRGLFRGAGIRSGFLGAYMLVLGFGERNFRNLLPSLFHKD